MEQRKPIGQILCEKGYITQDQLKQACEQQLKEYELLGQILASLGHITGEQLTEALELQRSEIAKSN